MSSNLAFYKVGFNYEVRSSTADECPRFLLAVLQMQPLLETVTKSEIRKYLRNLSLDLGQAFRNTMRRIIEQSRARKTIAIRTLMWTSHVLRPLGVDELCHALATGIGDKTFDYEAILKSVVIV